ncbi:putative sart-1 family protein [Rosellinia necatrix]|uniref:Putative sart-1 family protein n=1 Tax=Rosellinia necatrix TaxID=77044 RepID=A0A1S7UKE6_ROSNE|nr:putative sart-1 family protein [Rosellinia necatrix]
MDAASIEETNRLRVSLGMKPLPVPGASGPQFKEKEAVPKGEEPASTLETREAAAYDNYKKVQEADAAKKRREDKAAAVKRARDAAKRFEALQGKGLGDADGDDDLDAKAWLVSQKKRQKKIQKSRKEDEEAEAAKAAAAAAAQYTSKDLAGVKVRHEVDSFADGDEQILTLADRDVLADEEEGDELENIQLREQEKLSEKLNLKKKKPVYDPHEINETGDQNILSQYDEEISGKAVKRFTLDGQGNNSIQSISSKDQKRAPQIQAISLDFLDEAPPASDYLDISEVKVKKPKKKKSKSTRQRPADEDDIFPNQGPEEQSMDIDSGAGFISRKRKTEDSEIIDDEDLQANLAAQRRNALKKRKKMRPEDLARQFRDEALNEASETDAQRGQGVGLVIDEISEFVSGLTKEDLEERKTHRAGSPQRKAATAMEDESDEDEPMRDRDDPDEARTKGEPSVLAETAAIGVDEEKTISTGIGAALQLLRERRLVNDAGSSELNEHFRHQQAFLTEKRRRLEDIEQSTRNQRERDRQGGRLDRMSMQEREQWARQQNNIRDQQASRQMAELFNRDYKPSVDLKYVDEDGRLLGQKDAFKHLSHAFHGKGSGKGKTDKRLKKIEDEKRHESQSVLDASQNVGMSSAAAHQTRTRREAGVRLA